MNNINYRTKSKEGWPDGPWMNEPDKMQFLDEVTGYPCLIVRNHMGGLCGYVGVSKNHPYFEKGYDDVDVRVHGGLTFADHCDQQGCEKDAICHKVEDGEDDNVWWLGFDCGHHLDYLPKIGIVFGHDECCIYRDIDYVKKEIADLAKQLKEAELVVV